MIEKKKLASQGTMTDIHVERLQRPDLIYSRSQTVFQHCLAALQKDVHLRNTVDNDKIANLLRTHTYFKTQAQEFLQDCCQLMQLEVMPRNTILFQKGAEARLLVVVQGELSICSAEEVELLTAKHFGANLLILGSDCYAEMPELTVKCKSHCKLAVISKQDFKVNLLTQEISRITKEISMLYTFPIFKNLSFLVIRKFFANSFAQSFSCLDIVYTQEASALQVYLVMNGIFEMREFDEGHAKQVNIFTPGQLMGELDVLNQKTNRSGTAFCISDEGEVLLFDRAYFINHMFPLIKGNLRHVKLEPSRPSTKEMKAPKLRPQQLMRENRSISQDKLSAPKLGRTISLHQPKKGVSQKINNFFANLKQTYTQQQTNPSSISVNRSQHLGSSSNILQPLPKFSQKKVSASTTQSKLQKSIQITSFLQPQPHQQPQGFSVASNFPSPKRNFHKPLKIPLKNELLNKFLNQKEEYSQQSGQVNRMRRTMSQILYVDNNFPSPTQKRQ